MNTMGTNSFSIMLIVDHSSDHGFCSQHLRRQLQSPMSQMRLYIRGAEGKIGRVKETDSIPAGDEDVPPKEV